MSGLSRIRAAWPYLNATISVLRGRDAPPLGAQCISPADEADINYDRYLAERKVLTDIEGEQATSFDQAMLTLSGGALAISITFLHDIVPYPKYLWALYGSWGGFAGALISVTVSFYLGQSAARRQREILDSNEQRRQDGWPVVSERNWQSRAVAILNATSIGLFVVGVVFLALFSGWNLSDGGTDVSR